MASLKQALEDENWSVRVAAVEVLGRSGNPRAVELLLRVLEDRNVRVRAAAARALGRLGDRRAEEHLMQALKDGDGSVRSAAAEALAVIGLRHQEEYLVFMAMLKAPEVVYDAVKAFHRECPSRFSREVLVKMQRIRRKL